MYIYTYTIYNSFHVTRLFQYFLEISEILRRYRKGTVPLDGLMQHHIYVMFAYYILKLAQYRKLYIFFNIKGWTKITIDADVITLRLANFDGLYWNQLQPDLVQRRWLYRNRNNHRRGSVKKVLLKI